MYYLCIGFPILSQQREMQPLNKLPGFLFTQSIASRHRVQHGASPNSSHCAYCYTKNSFTLSIIPKLKIKIPSQPWTMWGLVNTFSTFLKVYCCPSSYIHFSKKACLVRGLALSKQWTVPFLFAGVQRTLVSVLLPRNSSGFAFCM